MEQYTRVEKKRRLDNLCPSCPGESRGTVWQVSHSPCFQGLTVLGTAANTQHYHHHLISGSIQGHSWLREASLWPCTKSDTYKSHLELLLEVASISKSFSPWALIESKAPGLVLDPKDTGERKAQPLPFRSSHCGSGEAWAGQTHKHIQITQYMCGYHLSNGKWSGIDREGNTLRSLPVTVPFHHAWQEAKDRPPTPGPLLQTSKLGARKNPFCHQLARSPWASHLASSVSFSFLICKMGTMTALQLFTQSNHKFFFFFLSSSYVLGFQTQQGADMWPLISRNLRFTGEDRHQPKTSH